MLLIAALAAALMTNGESRRDSPDPARAGALRVSPGAPQAVQKRNASWRVAPQTLHRTMIHTSRAEFEDPGIIAPPGAKGNRWRHGSNVAARSRLW